MSEKLENENEATSANDKKKKKDEADYVIKEPSNVKLNVRVDDEGYRRLQSELDQAKLEKEDLKAQLDAQLITTALQQFDEEKQKLLRIANPEDKTEIESLDSPERLEFYRGKYSDKLTEKHYKPPEQPGQARMIDRSVDSTGLQTTFESPREMSLYLLKMSEERDPNNKLTPRAVNARKILREMSKKLTIDKMPRRMVLEDDTILRMKGLTVSGKDEKGKAEYKRYPIGESE